VRKIGLFCIVAALFFIVAPYTVQAAIPQPAGYVTDLAGVLTAQQIASLNQSLSDYEQRTSNQIVVLIVKSLEGQDIESYSIAVAEAWKVGQKHKDNGTILLIAPSERKVRIEVGYGLEGVLTDAKSAEIIRNILAPRFRSGDYYGGITDAVSAMETVIAGEFTASRNDHQPVQSLLLIILLLLLFAPFFFFYSLGRPRGGGRWSSRSGYSGFGVGGGSGGGGFSGGGGGFGGGGASGGW